MNNLIIKPEDFYKSRIADENLGNPALMMMGAKILPYALLAAGGIYAISKAGNFIDNQRDKHTALNLDKWIKKDAKGVTYNAMTIAMKYDQALDGAGTYEDQVFDAARLARGGRWQEVNKAYFAKTGRTLVTDLKKDLSNWEQKQHDLILNDPMTAFRFSIGEVVATTQFTDVGYAYKHSDGSWRVLKSYFTAIGDLGKITARVYLNPTSLYPDLTHFYKTEVYPNDWICGKFLKNTVEMSWYNPASYY
jgi:hypothetical protein